MTTFSMIILANYPKMSKMHFLQESCKIRPKIYILQINVHHETFLVRSFQTIYFSQETCKNFEKKSII